MFKRHFICSLLVACAAVTGAKAQSDAKATPSPAPTPSEARDPVSKVPLYGLIGAMAREMKGQRVLAVGYATPAGEAPLGDDYQHAQTTIEKLQAISEAFSQPGHSLIPFKVGNALCIAPETREHLNPNLGMLSSEEACSRGTLLESALLGLSVGQMKQIGSSEGLAIGSLPAASRSAVMRAFRAPFQIRGVEEKDGVNTRAFADDMNWAQARVRVRLRSTGVSARLDDHTYASISSSPGGIPEFVASTQAAGPWSDRGVDLPVYVDGPNTFKSSDLAGKPYGQPLGLSGAWYVKDVIKRISAVTGLKMTQYPLYASVAVFIGSNAVTCGEAIDALRLGLTAAWRQLDGSYILVWDRTPLAAVQLAVKDATGQAATDVRKRKRELDRDTAWLTVLQNLPFASDDPLAPDAQQREKLFGDLAANADITADAEIPWEEMTPSQQDYIRERAKTDRLWSSSGDPGSQAVERPWTDADIRMVRLGSGAKAEWNVKVPDVGWTSCGSDWDVGSISRWSLRSIAARKDPQARNAAAMKGIPEELRQAVEHPEPQAMNSEQRGIVVPPLSAARLNALAAEMKRHGFNTLIYPVLYGGYATFPSQQFPLHPSLKGEDGFAAAVAAMKPAGIRVIGLISALAWQNEKDNVHWLNKHPEWLDVDAIGRAPLTWYQQHPNGGKANWMLGIPRVNFVRASEPAVVARVTAFLKEFAARNDAAGMAIDDWRPPASEMAGMFGGETAPPLGFSLADRVSTFRRAGIDPADIVNWDAYLPASLRDFGALRAAQLMLETGADPNQALLDGLIRTARSARKDWKVWEFDNVAAYADRLRRPSTVKAPESPRPDVLITNPFMFAAPGSPAEMRGVSFPIVSGSFFDALMDTEIGNEDEVPDMVKKMPSIAVYHLFQLQMPGMKGGAMLPAMVYDFRTAPEEITPSLVWVKPPAPNKEPKK
ncbi:MAG TPA: hypothetical protein VGM37_04400 [Armatimonadota bacterium]|jgi:hypothetical protein